MANSALDYTVLAPGQWKLIGSQTAANSATIDFTDLSTAYYRYSIVFYNVVPTTDAVNLYLRTSTNNGTSYDSGATDYLSRSGGFVDNTYGSTGFTASQIILSQVTGYSLGNGTGESAFGQIDIFNAGQADRLRVGCTLHAYNSYPYHMGVLSEGFRNSATAVNAVRLIMSSGNISTGTFILYGLEA